MDLIKKLLNENKWMVENSITFGDGTVLLLEKVRLNDSAFKIKVKDKTNIETLITENYENYSFFDVFKIVKEETITIHVGEGSFGGDGFIYVTNNINNELIWFAFFDFSNPFMSAILENNQIIAVTNNDEKWTFSLSNPEVIIIG